MDDISLMLDRAGVAQKSHFTFSYTPIHDGQGGVSGLYGVCAETTALVKSRARQVSAEHDLSLAMDEVLCEINAPVSIGAEP